MKEKFIKCGLGVALVTIGAAVYDGLKSVVTTVVKKAKSKKNETKASAE